MAHVDLLRVARVIIAVLGSAISLMGFRAFLKSRSKAMLLLAVGFLFITLGYVVSGLLFEVFSRPLEDVLVFEATLTAAGFVAIILSLFWAKD